MRQAILLKSASYCWSMDPKAMLNQFCQKFCKRPVGEEDIVYLIQRFQLKPHSGIRYQATVKLNCFARAPEFAGALSLNKKEARNNAASQALQAYQEAMPQKGPDPNMMTHDAVASASEKAKQPVQEVELQEKMGKIGVRWSVVGAWRVSWCEEKQEKARLFYVRQFMSTGKTYHTAKADALRAATALRRRLLEESGIAKAEREETLQSGVKGVLWNMRAKYGQVQLVLNGKKRYGGTFKPKDSTLEEVERARLAAVESRRKLEEEFYTVEQSEDPDSSYPAERRKRKLTEAAPSQALRPVMYGSVRLAPRQVGQQVQRYSQNVYLV